ncbi:MAG: cupin domain-containing protein [Candidatus Heimdallarchaeota archaeon]|nr:MAG: cupin domain-containing protein [Candidatus Heimdallarchaeota archaeon]
MIPQISINEMIKKIKKPWSPVVIARVNDQVIRLAMFKGSYPMHKHSNEDELFYVYQGKISIQLEKGEKIILKQGEMTVVPKGENHSPISEEESFVLMFEPSILESRGD